MGGKIRLIISTMQPELIAAIKNNSHINPALETVISVNKPSEIENKLNRISFNAILVDLDAISPDTDRLKYFQNRFNVMLMYMSASAARGNFAGRSGDDFILKPVSFNQMTSLTFASNLFKRLDSFIKQQSPPDTRELGKLVSDKSETRIVAVASSTGGTNALELLLKNLPPDIPPMLVVQHMPSGFTKLFAERLNNIYKQEIKEAETGDYIKRGQMLLAPADRHMRLIRQHGRLAVECFIGVKLNGVMPAADVLFESVSEIVKANAVGVVLTGMGSDGARGLLKMHNAGAKVIGQDERTCVVYGMPKVAKQLGAVDFELPLDKIPGKILALA